MRKDGAQLARYECFKRVWAAEITAVNANRLTLATDQGDREISVEPTVLARYTPVPGDFFVLYGDGYESISPKKAFVEGYRRLEHDA